MRYTEADIKYENGNYWVLDTGRHYEVIENTITHGKIRYIVGYGPGPTLGLERAVRECDRLAAH